MTGSNNSDIATIENIKTVSVVKSNVCPRGRNRESFLWPDPPAATEQKCLKLVWCAVRVRQKLAKYIPIICSVGAIVEITTSKRLYYLFIYLDTNITIRQLKYSFIKELCEHNFITLQYKILDTLLNQTL